MRKVFTSLVLLSCVSLNVVDCIIQVFVDSNEKFSSDVYTVLSGENSSNGKNFIISPTSAWIVLTLTKEGAKGVTAEELGKALSLPSFSYRQQIGQSINLNISTATLTVRSAIRLYVDKSFVVLPSFRNLARTVYRTDVENIDFSNHNTVDDINNWVENVTNGIITNLINPNQINDLTKFVFVNALYFKGLWKKPFDSKLTRGRVFYHGSNTTDYIMMMNSVDRYLFYDSNHLKAKFLELPYKDSNISMTVILPREQDGLESVENRLIKYLKRQHLQLQEVKVSIPKMNVSSAVDFKPILENLGVHQLFEEGVADLTGISCQKGLYVQFVNQKAYIGVSETGTEAAAATAVIGGTLAIPVEPQTNITFIADHPFFYYIRDNGSGAILFIGRYVSSRN